MRMPKAKPTEVFVHRIEFSPKEREWVEAYMASQTVKNLALGGAAGASVYIGYKAARAAYGWTEDFVDDLKQNTGDRAENALVDGLETVVSLFTGYGWLWGKS